MKISIGGKNIKAAGLYRYTNYNLHYPTELNTVFNTGPQNQL
jgi:hypothetical protein